MVPKNSHIAYFCPSKSWGGLEMNQLRDAKWMSSKGYKVLIFVQDGSEIHQQADREGITTVIVKSHKKYYDFINAYRLYRQVKKHKISHLIVRDPKDMGLCALTRTISLGKLFLVYIMSMQIGISKRDILHTIRFRQYDLWIAPLPYLKNQVLERTKFPEHKIKVIPSGINLEQYATRLSPEKAKEELGLDASKNYIGIIGRFHHLKGQHLLLEAFNKIKDQTDYEVVFLGSVTYNESLDYINGLKEFIVAHKIQDRVHFIPFREDVEIFYAALSIFVMASEAETFGMVTIEAMASGCKIVGSDRGGTLEILNHGEFGTLFNSGNSEDLASKLLHSIDDKDFKKKPLREEAKKYDEYEVNKQVVKALGVEE